VKLIKIDECFARQGGMALAGNRIAFAVSDAAYSIILKKRLHQFIILV